MISVDFAPNETGRDVLTSVKAFFSPWKKGKTIDIVRRDIATRFGVKDSQASLFLSGRSAIHTALRVLAVGSGDEVIVPGFTCEAVVLPIQEQGAMTIYADIDSKSYSATLARVRSLITSKTKAIFLQHTFGMTPSDRGALLSLAASKDIPVIEDMAHGFSSIACTDHPETIKLLSFGRSKAFSSVFGGALIVPQNLVPSVSKHMSSLVMPSSSFIFQTLAYVPLSVFIKATYDIGIGKAVHALVRALHLLSPEISSIEKSGRYDGWLDKKYPNALAVLLAPQLKRLNRTLEHHSRIARIYASELLSGNLEDYALPISRFPVLVKNRAYTLSVLHAHGILLGTWYVQPVAPKELDMSHLGYESGSCPTAEKVCEHIVNLPMHVTESQAQDICRMMKSLVL